MTKNAPMEDWVVYVMMIGIFISILYGKYLMARGDAPIQDVIKEDIDDVEHKIEDIIHDVEDKLK